MFGAMNLAGGLTGKGPKKLVQVNGNAQLDTAQSKFGGSSVLLDGDNDSLVIAGGSDFEFLDDFTFEFFVRLQDNGASQVILSNRPSTSYSTGNFYIQWADADNKFQWGISGGSAVLSTNTFSYNTWYHIALVRNSSTVQLYVNGNAEGSTYSTSDTNDVGTNNQTTMYVGLLGSTFDFLGHIDELRISNSARYSGSFTPTTTQFTTDENTMLLIHANGPDASTNIVDES